MTINFKHPNLSIDKENKSITIESYSMEVASMRQKTLQKFIQACKTSTGVNDYTVQISGYSIGGLHETSILLIKDGCTALCSIC